MKVEHVMFWLAWVPKPEHAVSSEVQAFLGGGAASVITEDQDTPSTTTPCRSALKRSPIREDLDFGHGTKPRR